MPHCEAGSRMATVTGLPPKRAHNKIVTASEIWDGHLALWLLLRVMSSNQPTEMQFEVTY